MSSFLANVDIANVAGGMTALVDAINERSRDEKYVIISALFNCLYNNKLKEGRTVGDIMEIVDHMRRECKRKKIPEFGAAERYIIGEL